MYCTFKCYFHAMLVKNFHFLENTCTRIRPNKFKALVCLFHGVCLLGPEIMGADLMGAIPAKSKVGVEVFPSSSSRFCCQPFRPQNVNGHNGLPLLGHSAKFFAAAGESLLKNDYLPFAPSLSTHSPIHGESPLKRLLPPPFP